MAFAAALERVTFDPQRNRKHMCQVVLVREGLSDEDAAALTDALRDPRVRGVDIATALREEGVTVGASSIQRHRNGRCLCESV